jgi:hypothetical protein
LSGKWTTRVVGIPTGRMGGGRVCLLCNRLLGKRVTGSTAGVVVGSTVSLSEEDNSCGGSGGVEKKYYGMSWLV